MPENEEVGLCDPNQIRRELFKLEYLRDEFNLYGKADTSEAIDKILTAIHYCISENRQENNEKEINPCVESGPR